jgi:hypothetical protein
MTLRIAITLLAPLSIVVGPFGPTAHAVESLRDRFFREAPIGWGRLRDSERQVTGRLHVEFWAKTGASKSKDSHQQTNEDYYFKRSNDSVVISHVVPDAPKQAVYGINQKYQFIINHDAGNANAPYAIFRLALGPPEEEEDDIIHNSTYFYRSIQAPREFWNVPLEGIIADPGFRLRSISESIRDGKPVVRVEFDCPTSKYTFPDQSRQSWTNAWMELAPPNGWALLKAEFDMKTNTKKWHTLINNDYRINRSGRLAIYRLDRVEYWPGDDIESHSRFTFEEMEDRVVPEAEFRLGAYGLTEPSQPAKSPRRSSIHLWFIGIALALLTIAIALHWAARRAAPGH